MYNLKAKWTVSVKEDLRSRSQVNDALKQFRLIRNWRGKRKYPTKCLGGL